MATMADHHHSLAPELATMADHHHQVSDVKILQFSDHSKSKNPINATRNVVIHLKDDDDDEDCVFVKRKKSFTNTGNHKQNPICVDEYVKEERQVQHVDITPKLERKFAIDFNSVQCVDDYDDDDEIRVVHVKRNKPFSGPSITEVGESSGSSSVVETVTNLVEVVDDPVEEIRLTCEICADSKPQNEFFKIKGCSHSYCSDCMQSYVASKLQDGVSRINCPVPSCKGVLEPEHCREILPFEVFTRWGNLLCESVILASQKFYCPFKDCSALLVNDGGEVVKMSECPSCFRLFCAQCKVGWHQGVDCAEYQRLGKDERQKEDIMLRNLAKEKQWQRCPVCKFYVEKSEGCLYMKCRCGVAFCYRCGAINTDHRYHYCKKCGR